MKKTLYMVAMCGAMLFASCNSYKAVSGPELSGRWNVVEVNGIKVDTASTDAPYLEFDSKDGSLSGTTGCNRVMGKYSVSLPAGKIEFSNVGATRMMCPDMTLETNMLNALNNVAGYTGNASVLRLTDGNGKTIMTMQR